MKVYYKISVVQKIDEAIYAADGRGKRIDKIELTDDEMFEFKMSFDYHCDREYKEGRSIQYRGVKITKEKIYMANSVRSGGLSWKEY